MSTNEEQLQLKFDPRTIEHLGIKMYSQLPYALAELVANAYDASAEHVNINLYDSDSTQKRIVIQDDGEGMSYEEVRDNFLVIGRKRREADVSRSNSKGRPITGKKGLGKLALFGIGKTITIETSKVGDEYKTNFTMDWDSILTESSGIYYPIYKSIRKENVEDHGTTITLYNLSRKTSFDLESTAFSLSRLFNCFDEENFIVSINRNDESPLILTKELQYDGINKEFDWDISVVTSEIGGEYPHKDELRGRVLSTKKPIDQNLRGITLYVNGRLANTAGFFGVPEAGHAFSYLSGWIEADFLDEFDKDMIATDRQSISWDLPEAEQLKDYLYRIIRFIARDWSKRRKEAKSAETSTRSGVNVTEWYEHVPQEIKPRLQGLVERISDKPELSNEDFSAVVKDVYSLIPPYTYYHYRLLHGQVQDSAEIYYKSGNYYEAFQEAMKRYKNAVKDKSGVSGTEDRDIVSNAFGKGKALETTANFKKRPNGQPFAESTLENIEEGQKFLSMGVVCGGRNVVSHEEITDLRDSKLFTEKDCLDLLSLLSHLFKRLDESQKR